jgi:hypothetical protein
LPDITQGVTVLDDQSPFLVISPSIENWREVSDVATNDNTYISISSYRFNLARFDFTVSEEGLQLK